MEKLGIAGDNRLKPVGRRWTTPCTPCGSFLRPQSVESGRPRIHKRLTWSDGHSTAPPVDTVWTTSQSPGCGRQKVTESVEGGRNRAPNRTADVVPVATHTGRTTLRGGAGASRSGLSQRSPAGSRRLGALGTSRGSHSVEPADAPRGGGRDPLATTAGAVSGGRGPAGDADGADGADGPGRTRKAPSGTCPGAPSPAYGRCRQVRAATWSAVLDAVRELGDLVVDRAALGHERTDLAVGVHHGRVVAAAELRADLRQ